MSHYLHTPNKIVVNKLANSFDCCTLFKQIAKSGVVVEITNRSDWWIL